MTMMNSTRNSMPWNQMMANTTHDSAGMPWKKVNTGAMKFSAVLDWPMIIARKPPRMKAPNSPPKIRPAVSSTSINRDPVVSISMVREMGIDSAETPWTGSANSPQARSCRRWLAEGARCANSSFHRLDVDGVRRRRRLEIAYIDAGFVDRIDLLSDLPGGQHVHAESVVGLDQRDQRGAIFRRRFRCDQGGRFFRMFGDEIGCLFVGRVELGNDSRVLLDPVAVRGDAEIGDALGSGEGRPGLVYLGIERLDRGLLCLQQGIGRFPELDGVCAISQRIADETRWGCVDDLYFRSVHPKLFGEEFEHHEIRGRTSGSELFALEVFDRLDLGTRGDDGSPEIKQVEQILHLDAAGVGETDREHGGAAANLELTRVKLRRVGVRRALDELDIQSVRCVELLRLDHRWHEGAKGWKAEYHDGDFRRFLGGGRGKYYKRRERKRGEGARRRSQNR